MTSLIARICRAQTFNILKDGFLAVDGGSILIDTEASLRVSYMNGYV